jgi:hypothetical protein
MHGCYCKVHIVGIFTTIFNYALGNYFGCLVLVDIPSLYAILPYDCTNGVNIPQLVQDICPFFVSISRARRHDPRKELGFLRHGGCSRSFCRNAQPSIVLFLLIEYGDSLYIILVAILGNPCQPWVQGTGYSTMALLFSDRTMRTPFGRPGRATAIPERPSTRTVHWAECTPDSYIRHRYRR